ncbi:MAG TPA: M1 family metallopeptidase [Chitinophagaceae bacterium]|nr:M1 family metallopeptidase [Chitinophagaceae bacterium]
MSRCIFLLPMIGTTLLSFSLNAQDLYMSRDVKQAYKNGTRSMDGKPGKNYWQNHGRYAITITAMPPGRTVKGAETITYINNSPDTLRSPSIKLFLNIHKPGAPREFGATPDYLTPGVHVDECKVNGQTIQVRSDQFVFTNLPVKLPRPLLPHDSVQFSFDWHYEISLRSGREGMIDSTTYFLAYFYPRVAVYDDYNGWDRMPFMESHEFYSDFNDYDVTINVPKNYIVVGTGTLQHPENLLQPTFLKRYNESFTSDQTIQIVTKQDWQAKNITTQNAVNSWRFSSVNVPDVAFGISDHFNWDGCSVVVDDATRRRAGAFAAYNDTAADYHHVAQYARHSLDWLSHHWPGIPYPYEKTTVFQGYAGMEYPMMANDESYEDTTFSRFVAEHEIAHTYMPFYMGINETRYGFMDEGWATTFEILIGRADLGVEKAEETYKQFRVEGWINDPSPGEDVPIVGPGDNRIGQALGDNEYGKASLGYLAMKDLLGDELFKKCLHEYMNRWHGKHPLPWDFFFTFNDVAKKNLNWFWSNWFFSHNYIDLAIKSTTRLGNDYSVTIENIGGMAAPVNIIANYSDGTKESFHQTPVIWQSNQGKATVKISSKKKVESISLDGGIFMDADTTNNTWKEKAF